VISYIAGNVHFVGEFEGFLMYDCFVFFSPDNNHRGISSVIEQILFFVCDDEILKIFVA
jgi:hypothetical protein